MVSSPSSSSSPPSGSSTAAWRKQQYLTLYNLVSTFLWFSVLVRVVLFNVLVGYDNIYGGTGNFVKWTQTLAVLEILHSALGIVRAPLLTTFLQVLSRLVVVWLIIDPFPEATTPSVFYTSMLVAWSVTEVVRYAYFYQSLRGVDPGVLTWTRYNGFFVLYPIGISSELVMMLRAIPAMSPTARLATWAVIAAYVPGSYVMYTHMMRQRRKMIKGKAPDRRQRLE